MHWTASRAARQRYDLHHLRAVHSVGEPLNPEAVVRSQEALGLPIHDNWWQTETGGIMIANYAATGSSPPWRTLSGISLPVCASMAPCGPLALDALEVFDEDEEVPPHHLLAD